MVFCEHLVWFINNLNNMHFFVEYTFCYMYVYLTFFLFSFLGMVSSLETLAPFFGCSFLCTLSILLGSFSVFLFVINACCLFTHKKNVFLAFEHLDTLTF